ncbi:MULTISPECIES: hypothetical protein [Cyanophyceae]|uniref:Uncharacterized protein n=1 Tax=Leptolyngbya subtilissima DQ-A4 TaxID=2933933 RepID=A0ABV0K5P3_9CYAN|nr:hypothetical protein [Nodosilinea sp. FACHB-141]MBD2114415.1 hypothetical protein [Nodosilinea sp. FACHB-141]
MGFTRGGWLLYDSTNRMTEEFGLIAVAIAHHPSQAIPLASSWFSNASDYLGMKVSLALRKLGATPEFK